MSINKIEGVGEVQNWRKCPGGEKTCQYNYFGWSIREFSYGNMWVNNSIGGNSMEMASVDFQSLVE